MTFTMINVNDTVRYAWRGGIKIIAKVLPGKKKGLLQVHKKWKKITIAKSTTTLFIRCRKLLSFQFGGEEKPHEAVMIHRHVIYNASSPFAIISLRGRWWHGRLECSNRQPFFLPVDHSPGAPYSPVPPVREDLSCISISIISHGSILELLS
jgi:hypothetical protein